VKKPLNTLTAAAALAACLGLAASGAWAAEGAKKGSNAAKGKPAATSPAAQAVENTRTAYALARWGDAQKDPVALVTAARMLRDIGSSDSTAKPSQAAGSKASGGNPMTVEAILARARTMAAGRADVVAMVDDVEKSGARGRVGGPGSTRTVVNTRATDVFTIAFRGGEPAAVMISGDGDSDLDLYVRDEAGNMICYSESNGDDEWCRWTPRWTGNFTIRVVNRGVANQYVLRTN
jgi:hypothetical protein